MKIVYNIGDHVFAKYLRNHNVDWDKTETKKNYNLFYDKYGNVIAIDIYNDAGSIRQFTIIKEA